MTATARVLSTVTTDTRVADPSAGDATITVRNLWKVFGPAERRTIEAVQELEHEGARALNSHQEARTHPAREGIETQVSAYGEVIDRACEQHGGTVAIRDVSFDVRPGEVFVVMGLSGSGKSTLVRCLTRLIEPTVGDVRLDGEDILKATPERLRELRRRRFSMVFQNFGLLPHRRVLDNIAFGLEIRGEAKEQRLARATEMLRLVGLEGMAERYPDQLSGGQQQRVGLARALAGDPEVMLLDEPFSALDPLIRRDMQNEVIRLHRELGKTMIFITHDLAEALKLGDHVMILRGGRIVQIGRPEDVVGAPADEYVADFVRDVPKSHVLTLRWVMRPATPADPVDGPVFPPDAVIRTAVHAAVASDKPLRIVSDGTLLGVVDRAHILAAIAGNDPEPPPQ